MWEVDYKESEVPKNWCFWTVVSEKMLESPLDCRRSNQSILKEISPEYSLEGLKLKLQYFGHLMWRIDSLERRRRGQQRTRWLDGSPTGWTWVWASSGSWWWTGKPGVLQSMRSQRVGHDWVTEVNWTEAVHIIHRIFNGTKNKRLCWASMKNSQNCHRTGLSNE